MPHFAPTWSSHGCCLQARLESGGRTADVSAGVDSGRPETVCDRDLASELRVDLASCVEQPVTGLRSPARVAQVELRILGDATWTRARVVTVAFTDEKQAFPLMLGDEVVEQMFTRTVVSGQLHQFSLINDSDCLPLGT